MKETHAMLDVDSISFDKDNPRIKMALEKYGDQLNAERVHFALRSASDNGGRSASSYDGLRGSIIASEGVQAPISVVRKNDEYVCVDGNTRLAIYKQLPKEGVVGDWSKIKAVIMDGATQGDIEKIRVSAHLVGSRQWPAYEKARYLHYLRDQEFMDYDQMVKLCGGNRTDIQQQIDAFHDMNAYYRDIVEDDSAFKIDRFSGFVELQKRNIKQAIFDAGLELKNFGEWIRDGKIFRLADTRELPKVLRDDEAKKIFLDGGPRSIEAAVKLIDQRTAQSIDTDSRKVTLHDASIYQLATVLVQRISELTLVNMEDLKKDNDENSEKISTFENLSERLQTLLKNVAE